jgi:hypothetical protein
MAKHKNHDDDERDEHEKEKSDKRRGRHEHDRDHDDGEVMERERDPEPEQKDSVTPQVVQMTGGNPLTVTAANPTPPTNIGYVSTGTPPVAGVAFNEHAPPTLTGDAALFPAAGVSPPVNAGSPAQNAGSITAIAAPVGGSGGTGVAGGNAAGTTASVPAPQPTSEATGTVVVNSSAPLAESLSVQGAYTVTPNASHPSNWSGTTTITGLVPASTPGTGGEMNLTVNGTGFKEESIVNINGVPNATNYISSTQLQAENAPKLSAPGTVPVTVVTNGVTSAASTWTFV